MSNGVKLGETRVRVRYAETDQMGVVYHANYLVWFEVGRVELMRSLGFDYRTLEANEGCLIAVVDASARYRLPARYDDELLVRARLKGVRSSMVQFGYEILRTSDNALLCTGETTHVVVGRNLKKRALPEAYVTAFRAAMVRAQMTEEDAAREPVGSASAGD